MDDHTNCFKESCRKDYWFQVDCRNKKSIRNNEQYVKNMAMIGVLIYDTFFPKLLNLKFYVSSLWQMII